MYQIKAWKRKFKRKFAWFGSGHGWAEATMGKWKVWNAEKGIRNGWFDEELG